MTRDLPYIKLRIAFFVVSLAYALHLLWGTAGTYVMPWFDTARAFLFKK